MKLYYIWDFGDNTKMYGNKVYHCFNGSGRYNINLDINDLNSGKLFFRKLTYDIEIVDNDQPYIESPDITVTGEEVEFNGLKSNCPGYEITDYFWDFGDGTPAMVGESVSHTFLKEGEYNVRLGLVLKSLTTTEVIKRAVTKKLIAFASENEKTAYYSTLSFVERDHTDIRQFENVNIYGYYSAEIDFTKESEFHVEVFTSKEKISPGSTIFRNIPPKYSIKEFFDPITANYSYVADQQMSLMATYYAYSELISIGFDETRVKIIVLTEPADREMHILKKNYGVLTDTYFDSNNRLISNAYLMLDQIVMLLNKYPGIQMEIGVHTDNQGTAVNLQELSQIRAQVIMNYLISRGINAARLSSNGFGGTRPIASNATWYSRRLNRRIEFNIVR